MNDDFNTSKALGQIFEFISEVNSYDDLSVQSKTEARDLVIELMGVFGIFFDKYEDKSNNSEGLNQIAEKFNIQIDNPDNVEQAILDARTQARADKN